LSFKDTPLWKEALNEVFHEKLDIPGSRNILVKILEGGIPCFVRTGLSNFGEMGLTKKYEIMPTEKPEGEIFELFKKRLLETKLKLLCCNCGEWSIIYRVKDIPENIQCPKCQARLIGVIKPFEEENEKILKKYLKKQSLNKAEEAIVENVLNSGSLVITYGKKAAFVLAGRGIGVKTASRILSPVLSDDDLIREILKAEKKYIETKRFWKE
jgi:ATP-dependent Lhr-like helicase